MYNGKINVASLVIESGRMLTIGVKSVVDIKNGTEETVVCFIMFFGVY
jgi:TATA-box binding protein (TBP) (component of TFIID and TFIIIB)